jgi:regulator of sigma E protease
MDILNIVIWFSASLIFILGPIILIHEIGHFLAARWAGVRVEEFGLGYPPRMLTLAGKEGYLEIDGTRIITPGRLRLPLGLARRQQVRARARKEGDDTYRLEKISLIVDDNSHGIALANEDTSESTIFQGEVTAFEPGTQYTLNWIPFGGFTRMTGEEDPSDPRSLAAQPKRWRFTVLAAGSLANLLAAFLLLTFAYMAGRPMGYHMRVSYIDPGSAAEIADLQVNDIIVGINEGTAWGETPDDAREQLTTIIQASLNKELTLTILRGGDRITVTAFPQEGENGKGVLGINMLSMGATDSIVRYSLPRASVMAVRDIGDIIVTILSLPSMLIRGEVSAGEVVQPTSVVGINVFVTFALQESFQYGQAWYALDTAALVSLALGLTNLLPLPALDGGRIVFIVIEAIRKRRVRPETEAAIHFAGMVILLTLLALVMVRDIVNSPWGLLNR